MDEEEADIRRKTRLDVESCGRGRENLIPILQKVQDRWGYLPGEALAEVARYQDMPLVDVYGAATFYDRFRLNRPGRHSVRVCMGTACHINGGGCVLDAWRRKLGVEEGQTTPDGEFDLERVGCVGCCMLAPVVVIGGKIRGRVRVGDTEGLVDSIEESGDSS